MDDALKRRVVTGLAVVRAQIPFLHEHFGRAESLWKHDGTRVTPADLAVSGAIFAALADAFPEDERFSEETEPGGAPVPLRARFAWVLDPIDGTNNYALGIPVCAISLGLLEYGLPVCGFIYDLGSRTFLHGGPGIGLLADGVPVVPPARTDDEMMIVAMHSPVDSRYMPVVDRVLRDYKLRAFGSGALHLAYVAVGRIDACADFTVKVWDVAAAWAFCRAAGVTIHCLEGDLFPLKVFDLHMRPVRYLAGRGPGFDRLVSEVRSLFAARE